MKIIGLDLESANTYEICSICWAGLVYCDGDFNVTQKKGILINPGSKKMHTGDVTFPFTLNDLKDKPNYKQAAQEIFRDINEDTLLIGHSIINDFLMLLAGNVKHQLPPFRCKFLDSQLVYALYKGELNAVSLGSCAENLGIQYNAHDPVEDAWASVQVIKEVLKRMHLTLDEFVEKFGIRFGEVGNYYIRQQEHALMDKKMRDKTTNVNGVYDYMINLPQTQVDPSAPRVWLKGSLFSVYKMKPIIKFLHSRGYFITYDRGLAKYWLGTKLSKTLCPKGKTVSGLQSFLTSLGYNKRLQLLRKNSGSVSSQMINALKPENDKFNDIFNGKFVTMTQELENSDDFLDNVQRCVVNKGGKYTFSILRSAYVIAQSQSELDDKNDEKLKMLPENTQKNFMLINELLES